MKLSHALFAAFVLLSPSAFATQDNSAAVSGSNNDLIQQTGNGNTLLTGSGAIGSATTNTANGGAGGNATANGGAGGSVIGSGNSSSVANGGQGGRGGDGGTGLGVGIGGSQSQSATTGNQSVSVSNKPAANSAWAAPLAASDEACMGSSSAAGQGVGFGLSIGSTWENDACNARKDATLWWNLGDAETAVARLCQEPKNRAARIASGKGCPGESVTAISTTSATSAGVKDRSAYPSNGSRNR